MNNILPSTKLRLINLKHMSKGYELLDIGLPPKMYHANQEFGIL